MSLVSGTPSVRRWDDVKGWRDKRVWLVLLLQASSPVNRGSRAQSHEHDRQWLVAMMIDGCHDDVGALSVVTRLAHQRGHGRTLSRSWHTNVDFGCAVPTARFRLYSDLLPAPVSKQQYPNAPRSAYLFPASLVDGDPRPECFIPETALRR
jgi:hypothetical protein